MGNALCTLVFQAAAITLGVYDWLITLDREVNLIWVRRWTPAKILFLVNRYFGPLYLLAQFAAMLFLAPWSDRVIVSLDLAVIACLPNEPYPTRRCQTWLEVKILFMGIFIWIWLLQFTLLYRTFAIYSSIKSVKRVLIGGYILGICINFLIFPILFQHLTVESQDSSKGTSCYFTSHSDLAVFWLPSFVYGLIFITLSVRIAIKHTQFSTLIYGSHTATWARFVRDSILYFAITSAVLIGNAAAWVIIPLEWYLIPMDFSIVIIGVAGNRLVFRLIQVYHGPPDDEQKSLDQVHMGDSLPLQVVARGSEVAHDRTSGSSVIVYQTRNSRAICESPEQNSDEFLFQG